jgi:hypothetical protein
MELPVLVWKMQSKAGSLSSSGSSQADVVLPRHLCFGTKIGDWLSLSSMVAVSSTQIQGIKAKH